MGVVGGHEFVIDLRNRIAKFLESDLKLSLSKDKTKITHMNQDRAQFLGFRI